MHKLIGPILKCMSYIIAIIAKANNFNYNNNKNLILQMTFIESNVKNSYFALIFNGKDKYQFL